MKKILTLVLALAMTLSLAACGAKEAPAPADPAVPAASELNIGVFYYQYSDAYITTVRTNMDAKLTELKLTYQDYDGGNNQANQIDQINTAITNGANLLIVNIVETSSPDAAQTAVDAAKTAGIPIIFFNREVEDAVVSSYDMCAFVGTDAAQAGHMQGEMIGEYLLANYDALDLNKDGNISYVMFKGQEGNKEAEYRTQFSVEDADKALTAGGKPALTFYDAKNASKYLVDTNGAWSAQAATDYMNTILAEYSEANKNMVELVIANNDGMAEGAVAALQAAGYNKGEDTTAIPVYGVDAMDSAVQKINDGMMTGTVKQDGEKMATTILALVGNIQSGAALMDNTADFVVDAGVSKIRVPYSKITA